MAIIIADDLDVCMDCAALLANDDATPEHRASFAAQAHAGQIVLSGTEDVDDTPFSIARCDGCGSTLAGYRTKAVMFG